jgi:hypothetical protein
MEMGAKEKSYPIIALHYRKGDLIMKEGDYGVSIYQIKKGHVRVLKQQGNIEVDLALLGPGEIFGEMVFLNKDVETRSASVRAMDDVELEIWHPARLSKEYSKMPPILRYITNQTLNRLARMNMMYGQLLRKKELAKQKKAVDRRLDKRSYYRKELNSPCIYRPRNAPNRIQLQGKMIDISVGGASMLIGSQNALNFKHSVGDEILMLTSLPSGRELELVGRISTLNKNKIPGSIQVGLEFIDLDGEAAKALGFFMMS